MGNVLDWSKELKLRFVVEYLGGKFEEILLKCDEDGVEVRSSVIVGHEGDDDEIEEFGR